MLHASYFRGKKILLSTIGVALPDDLLASFHLEHELRELWWTIQPGDVVIDVGAAYGSWTLTALAQEAAAVIAYEPNKSEFFDLSTNLLVNGWQGGRCLLINSLAGAKDSLREAYYPASHSFRPEGACEYRWSVPVDTIINRYAIPKVHWIKIDVEGAELEVLKGCWKTIQRDKPTLIVENHTHFVDGVDEEVRQLLKPLGGIEENLIDYGGGISNMSKWTWK